MNCDPEEVLHHLHLLGYKNVSEKQLTEFIRDLKKLIKYDQRKMNVFHNELNESHEINKIYKENYFFSISTKNAGSQSDVQGQSGCEDLYTSNTTSTSCNSEISSLHKTLNARGECNLKDGMQKSTKQNAKKLLDAKISNPSFIRSWQTNQKHGLKNDPVARYQWYQRQWNNLKVPGEEGHSQLRWLVRERMLGDDPHPRPTSWTSGRCSRNSCSDFRYRPR